MAPAHRTPLRGRDGQLAEAKRVLRNASVDGRAGAIVIRGPAGSGKSRLIAAVVGIAAELGFRSLEGSGDIDAVSMPLAPLLQAVLGGTPPLVDRRSVQQALLGDDARYVVIEEIIDALERTAREQPLLVAIDDLQFGDPTTLFALRVMSERLSAEPVVWVVAIREPVREDAVVRTIDRLDRLNAATLALPRFAESTLTQIAEDFLGGVLDENLRDIVHRSDGQVLDLVEALRGLVEESRVAVVDGHAALDDTRVPTRLRDLVDRRLAQLPTDAVDFVAAAAMVGRAISAQVVAAVLGRPTADAATALRAAEEAQLVVGVENGYVFRHDLIREAIDLTLAPDARRELRRATVDVQLAAGASVLEVAAALAATADIGDAHAAELLQRAAREVSAVNPSSGADLVGRAAELIVDDPARRGQLLAQQVMLLWQAGRGTDAQRIGEQAIVGGLNPLQEAATRLGLARVMSEHSYLEAGRQAAVALSLPGLSVDLKAQLLAAQCVTKIMVNDFDGLDEDLAAGLKAARTVNDHESEASLLATRSTLSFHQMDWGLAIDQAEQGRRVAEGISSATSMWSPKTIWQAILLSTVGFPEAALHITDHGIAEATAARYGSALSLWMMIRCRVLLEAGRLTDAQAEAETVLTMNDWRERSTMADYTVNFVLRRIAQYTGDPVALRRTQSWAAQMARDAVSSVRRQGKWLAAMDADADGHPDLAIEFVAEGIEAIGKPGNAFSLDPTDEPAFARIAARAGRRDLAARAAEFTDRRAALNPRFPLLQAVAQHTRGLVDDDRESLRSAAELFDGIARPLPRAAAFEDAGRVDPDRDTAVALLDEAHAGYAEAGALRDAARVRQRLRGLGVRRRQPRQEWDSNKLAGLTPAERAVVELVARGATNREVAAQLFLSPHTVSSHLRHAFVKVGVRSRVELARLATLNEGALAKGAGRVE